MPSKSPAAVAPKPARNGGLDTPPNKLVKVSTLTPLSKKHVEMLQELAIRAVGSIVLVLFFWGTIAPAAFDFELMQCTRNAGVCAVLVLGATFYNAYEPNVEGLSRRQKTFGFIVFWFAATIFFDFTWQKPLWNIPAIRYAEVNKENLRWMIAWWSYGMSDRLYKDCTPIMITFEIWWFLGNIPGMIGLYKQNQGKFNQALVMFTLCGILQCYNATVYSK